MGYITTYGDMVPMRSCAITDDGNYLTSSRYICIADTCVESFFVTDGRISIRVPAHHHWRLGQQVRLRIHLTRLEIFLDQQLAREALRLLNIHPWTQGTSARDRLGFPCNYDSPAMESLDLFGALALACRNLGRGVDGAALIPILKERTLLQPVVWHDACYRTRDDIINLLEHWA